MYWIKKILFRFLPDSLYVRTLHRGFYLLYTLGLLKKDKRFKYHYAVQKLIQKEFTVVDIGANLGYFAKTFARKTPLGKVICIEPIPLFANTLRYFLNSFPNVEIHNVALGKENKTVSMTLPKTNGIMRTGLPHIRKDDNINYIESETIQVEMLDTKSFFEKIDKIDYIKCDIEGYERVVFEEIEEHLNHQRPIVQIEISEENRAFFFDYFERLNFEQYGIVNFKFIKEHKIQSEEGDFLFVPKEKIQDFEKQIQQ